MRPAVGINSWYMLHKHLFANYSWMPGYCASADLLDIATWMANHSFIDLGYTWANFDDCIVVGRDAATGELIPDPAAFPEGPAAVSARLAALGFKMGWCGLRTPSARRARCALLCHPTRAPRLPAACQVHGPRQLDLRVPHSPRGYPSARVRGPRGARRRDLCQVGRAVPEGRHVRRARDALPGHGAGAERDGDARLLFAV